MMTESEQETLLRSRQHEWLVTTGGDTIIPDINGRHFSRVADSSVTSKKTGLNDSPAMRVLSRHFGKALHAEDCLYVLIGSDSGELIRFLATAHPRPRGTRWIVIEPREIHDLVITKPGIDEFLDEFIQLIPLDEWEETAELLQINAYFRIDGVRLERSLGALDAVDPAYVELTAHFDNHLTARRFEAQINDVAPFIKEHALSAVNFDGSASRLKDLFQGKRCVVLAGGPSLDLHLDWLINNRHSLFIIAVSRISGRLLEVGLIPDVVTHIDPKDKMLATTRQMHDFPSSVLLVTGSHPHSGLANRWPHAHLCIGALVPWFDQTLNSNITARATGPTVTHMSVQLAGIMGFGEVIFAGLDLCHSATGHTHARGSEEASVGPTFESGVIPVDTNSGTKAWTTPVFFSGIKGMEMLAQTTPHIRLINISEQAAAINGVDYVPRTRLDLTTPAFDRTALDEVIADIRSSEKKTEWLNTLFQSANELSDELLKVGNLAQLGLESNQAFFNAMNAHRQKRHKRRMKAIDRMLAHKLPRAAKLAQLAALRAIRSTDLPHDFFELSKKQAESLGNRYYAAIQREAIDLRKTLDTMMARIETRLMEVSGNHDCHNLATRYLEYGEPERAHWPTTHRHCSQEDMSDVRAAYDSKLQAVMEEQAKTNQKSRSPRASLRLIERLFSIRDSSALESLVASLNAHELRDISTPYAHYGLGLLHELEGTLTSALESYRRALDTAAMDDDQVLLEHALLRIAAIQIGQAKPYDAVDALTLAAEINPALWQMQARLALLNNDAETGIKGLSRHLEVFPSDAEKVKQLIRLFVALKIPEGLMFCEQYLDFCSAANRLELETMLKEAKKSLDKA